MSGIAALHVDFQRSPEARRPWLGWLVLLIGVVILAAAYAEYESVQSELAEARGRLGRARPAASPAAPADARENAEATRAAQLVREQLDVPWGRLFVEVESAAHEDIALLSLQAAASGRALRVSGEARNFAALMAYVRRLEASPLLAEVRLTGHEVRQQDARRPVAFALSASWMVAP